MSKNIRALVLTGMLVAAFAAITITAGAQSASKGKADTSTVYTSITHAAGGYDYAAGNAVGKVFKTAAVTYKLKIGATKSGITLTIPQIVLYTPTGALTGSGTAKVAVSGANETITDGKFDLNKGTGTLKGHSYVGTLTGTGSTTTNQFVFKVKATYN
jgi:hypothetical protein